MERDNKQTITGEYDPDAVSGLKPVAFERAPDPVVEIVVIKESYNDCKNCGNLYPSSSAVCTVCWR